MKEDYDRNFMKEAITWAQQCNPAKESIPKVGAIIAVGPRVIGRGRRGTGIEGDNDHAEQHAINAISQEDKRLLPQSTLYTTLEPCTREVRSNPLKCCTELIHQHRIKRVFIGILDPNQGVTGKGLWYLQRNGVEVALFPHGLSEEIRVMNTSFIRSQETLGVTFISPRNGQEIRTYLTGGVHPIRFESLNPPGPDTYLLEYKDGQYWPQAGPFRSIEPGVWETDAHFGSVGECTLQIVTVNDLGKALIQYYWKVVEENKKRRERLQSKVERWLLGGDHPGIPMNGLPKGIRLEGESLRVFIAYNVTIIATSVNLTTISRGETLTVTYVIECAEKTAGNFWLGASFVDNKTGRRFFNTNQDKQVDLAVGQHMYTRDFTIAMDAPLAEQTLSATVWLGVVGQGESRCIAIGPPNRILITE